MTSRIAYLTSQYPAPSHTFIRREVSALRAIGVGIDTFSVRVPPTNEMKGPVDAADLASTYVLLRQSPLAFFSITIRAVLAHPLRTFRSVMLALRHRPPGVKAAILAIAHFAEAMVLAAELRRRGISHLHNHFANSGATVGMLAARQLGITWSFTIHGVSEFDYPAGLLLGEKIAAASFVACVSYFGQAQAYRLVDSREWDKLSVVRCGLDLSELPPSDAGPSAGTRLILVGRLSPEKGIGGLLQALAMIPEANRPSLTIVGDGPMRAELDALVGELGLGEVVSFAGRLTEAETLAEIARSDALVLPSFMEGLPIVLMEAMALGKPVIATRVAGVPELVTDGVEGLLFTPSRWDELSACIATIARDEALRRRLGAAGPARIASEFDIKLSAEALRRLFLQAAPSAATASAPRIEPASGTWAASTADRAASGSALQD